MCCQFIFKPGTYDDDFHRLDAQLARFRLETAEDLIADLDAALTTVYRTASPAG